MRVCAWHASAAPGGPRVNHSLSPIGDPPETSHSEVVMAETTKAHTYQALTAVSDAEDDHWSVPQTAMFVTVASAGLWTLILFGVRWLTG
jgi:hypothetical protein